MSRIYLSLGTNLGDQVSNIEQALTLLSEKVHIIKISSFYETEPVGFKDQPWFLNIVISADTDLSPHELLSFTQGIEHHMKREKTILNGPRIIDVDILLYNDLNIDTEKLLIPHPRMLERAFVMVPLYEIAPDLILSDRSIGAIMENFKGEEIRQRLADA